LSYTVRFAHHCCWTDNIPCHLILAEEFGVDKELLLYPLLTVSGKTSSPHIHASRATKIKGRRGYFKKLMRSSMEVTCLYCPKIKYQGSHKILIKSSNGLHYVHLFVHCTLQVDHLFGYVRPVRMLSAKCKILTLGCLCSFFVENNRVRR
jgi:hypothetical protein